MTKMLIMVMMMPERAVRPLAPRTPLRPGRPRKSYRASPPIKPILLFETEKSDPQVCLHYNAENTYKVWKRAE